MYTRVYSIVFYQFSSVDLTDIVVVLFATKNSKANGGPKGKNKIRIALDLKFLMRWVFRFNG